jgi:hypothetical protein
MQYLFLILIYSSLIISISGRFKVLNFLASYFTISAVISTTSFIISDYSYLLKVNNLYLSIIVLGSIFGIIIKNKYYPVLVFNFCIILLFLSVKFNINFYTSNYLLSFEISIFIAIGIFKNLFKKFYFYLFIIFLSTIFITDYWINLLFENRQTMNNLDKNNLFYSISILYQIIFYIIFIIYHVKFRTNK